MNILFFYRRGIVARDGARLLTHRLPATLRINAITSCITSASAPASESPEGGQARDKSQGFNRRFEGFAFAVVFADFLAIVIFFE